LVIKDSFANPKETFMLKTTFTKIIATIPLIIFLIGCAEMPGNREQQGAVIGGAAGAATGAAVAKEHRVLGALIGGLLGAGGGYIIAAKTDIIYSNDRVAATQAARKAQEYPATAEEAKKAMTADLNLDGFVTLDEVVAMEQAGFTDEQLLNKMRGTDQVFELTADQQKYLRDHGVSQNVVNQMQTINRDKAKAISQRGDVIGRPGTGAATTIP
jgi:hypothetical protein